MSSYTRTTATNKKSRPPSRAATTLDEEHQPAWCIALNDGRGIAREIGLAAIELDLGTVVITQYIDTPTFVKTLHLFTTRPPAYILVPATYLNKQSNQVSSKDFNAKTSSEASMLVQSIQDAWGETPIIPVDRRHWNDQAGFEFVTQLIIRDQERTATILGLKSKYYALSAVAAMFKYLQSQRGVTFPPESLKMTFAPLEGTCLIDSETAAHLELVANLVNKKSKQHLLGLLNHCFTPMGTRLMRTNILSPLTDVSHIDSRLDAVEELVGSEERFHAVRKALEPLKKLDLDKMIGQIVSHVPLSILTLSNSKKDPSKESEAKVARALQLRTFLSSLPALRTALMGVESSLLSTVVRVLKDQRLEAMLDALGETLNDDVAAGAQKGHLGARNTRIFAVKANRKRLLEVARETYRENISDAFEMCEDLSKQHGLDITLVHSNSGFVFSCAASELEDKRLPKGFVNQTKKGKKVEFMSMELKMKNARLNESVQEVFIMSNEVLDELIQEMRDGIASLYRCSECIAMLDMLAAPRLSFNTVFVTVRPEWTDTLAIKAGRHPLHERFRHGDGSFVPNDTYANDSSTFQIVGHLESSGKSTLLRQIALLYIMGQIGSYVPASYASFRAVTAILSRLSNDDSIEASLSTFSKEMSTMAMILSAMTVTDRCLIIVDELGRGTSPSEGVGIAHAIAEEIVKSKALCFFATHFKELSTTLGRYPNVVSLHLETEVDASQPDFSLTFHHRVRDGFTPLTHYGLELAKLAKLPSDVLLRADHISHKLEDLAEDGKKKAKGNLIQIRRREFLKLRTTLQEKVDARGLTKEQLVLDLKRLQWNTMKMLMETMGEVKTREDLQGERSEMNSPSSPLAGSGPGVRDTDDDAS
ncbi:hypothetical protein T439DRAFT_299108 [Meredithblackwellia eburnea MCA 4105]